MSDEELKETLERQAETIEALRKQNEHLSELLEEAAAARLYQNGFSTVTIADDAWEVP